MTKGQREAQQRLRDEMQATVNDKLRREHQFLIRARQGVEEGHYREAWLKEHAEKFNGMVSAFMELGFNVTMYQESMQP